MRLVTVRQAGGLSSAGRVEGEEIVLLPYADVGELLASGDWSTIATQDGQRIPAEGAELGGLVRNPSKIFCVGRNYVEHIREGNPDAPLPDLPELFTKFAESLAGPYDDIPLPAGAGITDLREAVAAAAGSSMFAVPFTSDCVDWEAELVVVIGRPVRRAGEAEAAAAIAGFTVGNDVSVRDWQFHTSQWTQGKAWEAMSPVGPALVTTDELGVRPDLRMRCLVDETVMQDSRTSGMVFDPVDVVAYASRIVTLQPGDMIFTGTISGVGVVKKPPVFLRPGQVLTTEIEGIGETVNRLVAEDLPEFDAQTTGAGAATAR